MDKETSDWLDVLTSGMIRAEARYHALRHSIGILATELHLDAESCEARVDRYAAAVEQRILEKAEDISPFVAALLDRRSVSGVDSGPGAGPSRQDHPDPPISKP